MTAERPPIKTRLIDSGNGFDLYETTDSQGSLYVTLPGESKVLGGAWGPSADGDGNWFAWRAGTNPVRVASRAAAITYATTTVSAVAS